MKKQKSKMCSNIFIDLFRLNKNRNFYKARLSKKRKNFKVLKSYIKIYTH